MRTILVSNSPILGKNIAYIRKKLGMNEQEFCRRFDVGELMLEELEEGSCYEIYLDSCEEIARVMNITADALVKEDIRV